MNDSKLLDIIRDSLKIDDDVIEESYVAQPKHYDLPAESVTQHTKNTHVELYENYVKDLNKVSAQLDTARRIESNVNSSEFRSLKLDEVNLLNAVYLHELYFANSFDPSSECYTSSLAYMRIQRDWGDFDSWQRDFYGCAMAAREGWVIMGFSTFLKRYVNIFIDLHTGNIPIGFYPVIVTDLWTHAFRDYDNDRREYIVTQMRELNWNVIEERCKRAEKIAEAVQ